MTTPTTLNTPVATVTRVKYFRVPFYMTNMLPNTTYTAQLAGNDIGPWCKPNGQLLGAPLTSDATGKLRMEYLMSIPYNTTYLTNPSVDAGLLYKTRMITLTSPQGDVSYAYLPITLKSN